MQDDSYILSFTAMGVLRPESVLLAEPYARLGNWDAVRSTAVTDNLLQARKAASATRVCRELVRVGRRRADRDHAGRRRVSAVLPPGSSRGRRVHAGSWRGKRGHVRAAKCSPACLSTQGAGRSPTQRRQHRNQRAPNRCLLPEAIQPLPERRQRGRPGRPLHPHVPPGPQPDGIPRCNHPAEAPRRRRHRPIDNHRPSRTKNAANSRPTCFKAFRTTQPEPASTSTGPTTKPAPSTTARSRRTRVGNSFWAGGWISFRRSTTAVHST